MKLLEIQLRRARLCCIGSTVLFVLFCLFGAGTWGAVTHPWVSESLRIFSYLSGVFAWSLMCVAYDLRRKAF
jgi:hypothetical protein